MRIIVIIPAYNEEKCIEKVVKGIKEMHQEMTVLVVNDGSKDQTEQKAVQAGAEVISLPHNLGIGGAMQTGYMYAYQYHYDIAIQMDADGQHKPEELKQIMRPLLQQQADLALGSRFIQHSSYKSSLSRRIGIIILAFVVSLMTRVKIKDVTSGFRAVNAKGIKLFSEDYSTDYPEVDSLVLAHKSGFRIKEVPVEMEQRQAGFSSIHSWKSIYYMIKVTLSVLVKSVR